MSLVKKQHYVPQFYLRRFANTNSKVSVYDKFKQKAFLAGVGDVATSKHFYNLPEELIHELEAALTKINLDEDSIAKKQKDIQDVQIIEKKFSRLENRFARILGNVINDLDIRKRFKRKYRGDISLFMAVQFWRTNDQRQSMMELEQKVEEKIMPIIQKINEIRGTNVTAHDLGIAYNAKETATRHKMFLLNNDVLDKTAHIFNSHIWVIGINGTDKPLYTSDNPIAKCVHKTDDWRSNSGIESPGIEIMFPLSPNYILTMFERDYFRHIEETDGKTIYLNKDNIIYKNSHQIYSSYRQIYSPSNEFDLVEQMLQEQPNLKKPQSRWE